MVAGPPVKAEKPQRGIQSIPEAEKQIRKARRDLETLIPVNVRINLTPCGITQNDAHLLHGLFGAGYDPKNLILHWQVKLKEEIERIEAYIRQVEDYMKQRNQKAHRCTLPKKQQRKLGLLPPI